MARRARLRAQAVLGVVLAAALVPAVGACSTGAPATGVASGRIRVVAAENSWGSIVQQLGGTHASVTSIIRNPATDPHDYEPTPDDARLVASAGYVVENGIGYDVWMQKLLDANPVPGRRVLNVGRLVGVAKGGNPHQWYSPESVGTFVTRVSSDLARLDPTHRSYFEQRRVEYERNGLAAYADLVGRIRSRYAGTPIGASESVVTPLARSLGLDLVTPRAFLDAVAEGSDPTARDKATADAQIQHREIEVFVYNRQNATPDVRRLVAAARSRDIPVTTVTETLEPAGATFQDWQVRQLGALARALATATGS
jgi:zinc/manganese transport system substrate-binding protein